MHSQPDGRLVPRRARYPVGAVGGDQNMVARVKTALTFALDTETCRSGKEQNPFVMGLAMGLIHRRRLTSRDDPFNANILSRHDLGKNLRVCVCRKVIEKVGHGHPGLGDGPIMLVYKSPSTSNWPSSRKMEDHETRQKVNRPAISA
jgi:hypothetical protein